MYVSMRGKRQPGEICPELRIRLAILVMSVNMFNSLLGNSNWPRLTLIPSQQPLTTEHQYTNLYDNYNTIKSAEQMMH